MQNAMDEIATMVNGLVVNVTTDGWNLQSDGTYKKTILLEQITGKETLDVCLYPGDVHSEAQIVAFGELVSSIDTAEGMIVLTAVEQITVPFRIFLYGKINFDQSNLVAVSGSLMEVTEISKADFDKLSDAEKASGVYYVSDGDGLSAKNLEYDGSKTGLGNNVQDAIDKLSEQNKKFESAGKVEYSTEEQPIGTWIDGKTLYRRCFSISKVTISSGTWGNLVNLGSNVIDTLVNAVFINTSTEKSVMPCYATYGSGYLKAHSMVNVVIDKIVIEYTKP